MTAGVRPVPTGRRRTWMARTLVAASMALTGCGTALGGAKAGSPPAAMQRQDPATAPARAGVLTRPSSPVPATAATTSTVPPPTATTSSGPAITGAPPDQPGWTALYATSSATVVDRRTVTLPDGASVTVARFRAGLTRFVLHVGRQDPPSAGLAVPAANGPAIASSERPLLLAAFNGGFKTSTGVGGFEVAGSVLVPLRDGYESLVIDSDGTAHIGTWQQGLPAPGEQVAAVRQNLGPLVEGGVPSPAIDDVAAWGAPLGGVRSGARSALGESPQGDLLDAGSMHALPSDMAQALVDAGARDAMELDINPEWVQLDLAASPGGRLSAAIPGQSRPADQYLSGWTRDFVTVMAASG